MGQINESIVVKTLTYLKYKQNEVEEYHDLEKIKKIITYYDYYKVFQSYNEAIMLDYELRNKYPIIHRLEFFNKQNILITKESKDHKKSLRNYLIDDYYGIIYRVAFKLNYLKSIKEFLIKEYVYCE